MTKCRWKPFVVQFYDHTGIARRLERLALEGWKLEAVGSAGFWKFRRIEPAELHYTVVYFAEASEFDPEPGERQAAFIDLCSQSGWEYIGHQAQMLIFCSEEADPIPIETDAAMQVETIHKAVKKNFLPAQIVLLCLAVLQLAMQFWQYSMNPLNWLSTNSSMLIVFCYALIFLMCAIDIGTYYSWRRKARIAAQEGGFVETKGRRGFHLFCLGATFIVSVPWLYSLRGNSLMVHSVLGSFAIIISTVVIVNGVKRLMQKLKVDREINRMVTYSLIFAGTVLGMIVVTATLLGRSRQGLYENKEPAGSYEFVGEIHYIYDDPLPLTLEGLGYTIEYEHQSQVEEVTGSLLVTVYNGSDIAPWGERKGYDLYYTLYVPRFAGIMDTVVEGALEDRYGLYGGCREIHSAGWEADGVYEFTYDSQPNGHYVVVWPDRVLDISYPNEAALTAEQIAATVTALKDFEVK